MRRAADRLDVAVPDQGMPSPSVSKLRLLPGGLLLRAASMSELDRSMTA
jgi:hypothetical protein